MSPYYKSIHHVTNIHAYIYTRITAGRILFELSMYVFIYTYIAHCKLMLIEFNAAIRLSHRIYLYICINKQCP